MQTETQVSNLAFNLISSLDIDNFEDMTEGVLVLLNPKTKEKTTSSISLASPEHESRKKLDLKRTRALRQAFNQTGQMPVKDPLEDYEEDTDYLVAATLGWNLTKAGAPLEFSPAAARALYTDPKKQWIRQQVLDGLKKGESFIKSSAKA